METPCTGKLYTLAFRITMPQGHLLRASVRLRHGRWTIAAFAFFFFPYPPARFPLPCFSSTVGLGSLGWVCLSSLLEREMLSVFFVSGFGRDFIDLLMGLFRGAVFRHGGGALKQPIKQPTETPTSTLALMGRFPSLMGRFSTLMGRFTDFVLRGRFTS